MRRPLGKLKHAPRERLMRELPGKPKHAPRERPVMQVEAVL